MKIGLVHNPSAGKNEYSAEDLDRLLSQAGYTVFRLDSKLPLLEQVQREKLEFIVIAGGDGTVRRAALELVDTGVVIAPLPMGTANNLSKSLGAVGTPEEIISNWKTGGIREVDVGIARGPWGQKLFLEGGGMGLVGRSISIIEKIDEAGEHKFSEPEDKLHRDLSVFIALAFELPAVAGELTIDGELQKGNFLLVEILNIKQAGPRIELASKADPTDGYLDVVVARSRDRHSLKLSLQNSLKGNLPHSLLESRKAREVSLLMAPGEFRLDDQVVFEKRHVAEQETASINISFSIKPKALRVLAPATQTS